MVILFDRENIGMINLVTLYTSYTIILEIEFFGYTVLLYRTLCWSALS